jgi:hypothetical protein
MTGAKPPEEKIVGSSYIMTFYKNVQLLTTTYGQYINLLLELEGKHGKESAKITTEETQVVGQVVQTLRFYVINCQVQIISISQNIKEPVDAETLNKLNSLYGKIKSDYLIKSDVAEEYVTVINSLLLKTVIKTLLESSADIMAGIYGE